MDEAKSASIAAEISKSLEVDKPRRMAVYNVYGDLMEELTDAGIPREVVEKFLGHFDVKITPESYGTDMYYAILNKSVVLIKEAYDSLSAISEQVFVDRMKMLAFVCINPPEAPKNEAPKDA